MKGETEKFNKTFLWVLSDSDGPKKIETYEGNTLLQSITVKLKRDNFFLDWDKTSFGIEQTPEEKSIKILEELEDGLHKILVLAITNPIRPILIFPKDKRDSSFDDKIIGYKYSIDAYIKANEEEDQVTFKSFTEAKSELDSLRVLQPENVYKIRNVTKDEDVITS